MSIHLPEKTASVMEKQNDRFSAGDWLFWKREYEKAREHFQNVVKESSGSDSDLVRCYKSIGATEVELQNYDEALNVYNKQLDLLMKCESSTKDEDIIACYVSIGKVYWLRSDYDQSIIYHQRAIEYARTTKQPPTRILSIHKNLANIYTNTKAFDLAFEHFQIALNIDCHHLRKDHLQFGQTYANIGIMYQSKQDYQKAFDYFEQARDTWLRTLPPTHVYIEKIDKTIRKIKSKLISTPTTPAVKDIVAQYSEHVHSPLDILARNNIMVIWLDEYIGQDENCQALKAEFRQLSRSLKMVDSVDSCRKCLPFLKDRKVFFIIQGKHAKEIVPDIVSSLKEPIVYIFCLHMIYLTEWAVKQECILNGGMFDHEKDLLSRLTRDLNNFIKQKSKEYENYLQSELLSTFLKDFTKIFDRCCQERDTSKSHHPIQPVIK